MTGKRLDHYSSTTINHRLAALTGLFTFRALREPDLRNPIPSGREARRVSVEERNGLLDTWSDRNDDQPYACANRAGYRGH